MASGYSGYGRGGRGAALLQALQIQVRRPGQEASTNGTGGAQPQSLAEVSPPKPIGRAAMLQRLLQQQQLKQPSAQQVAAPAADTIKIQPRQQPSPSGSDCSQVSARPKTGSGAVVVGRPGVNGNGRETQAASLPAVKPNGLSVPVQAFGRGLAAKCPPLAESATGAVHQDPTKLVSPSAVGDAQRRQTGFERMVNDVTRNKAPVIHKGTQGTPVPIATNYIAVRCQNDGVYHYDVSFSPSIDNIKMRKKMMNEHRGVLGPATAFDGASLFLTIKLPNVETYLDSERPTDGEKVTICVKFVSVRPPASCIQIYNIVFRNVMKKLKLCQVGSDHYDPSQAACVPQYKLEVWPGYITSIREYEGGLMLLTDVSHRILRTETVLDIMYDIRHRSRDAASFKDETMRQLLGSTVLTRYNNRAYRIDDIDWDRSPESTFTRCGQVMSYINYYRDFHKKDIVDSGQPLLIHRPKKRERRQTSLEVICLIPELSFATGLTNEMRENYKVQKDLATHTRVTPMQRQFALRKFCANVKKNVEARTELEKWGLQLDDELMRLEGRKLDPERISFKEGAINARQEADWGRELQNQRMIRTVDLNHWLILYTMKDAGAAREFLKIMRYVCTSVGMKLNNPYIQELRNDRTETYLRAIRDNIDSTIQLVVAIFPTPRDDRYNAFKKLCCVDSPVPSQVINTRTIRGGRNKKSVCQNIVMQINCKLGGELWEVKIPSEHLLVCGIDVYHEVSKAGRRSVAGFVSSLNQTCTRWYSQVCHQNQGQELIDGLKLCFNHALRKYHEVNHYLPDRIIVYRDGVSDGQLHAVADYEVAQLSDTFRTFEDNYQPKLGVIVVQKKINTRIFALHNQRDGSTQLSNPQSGTILDHTVTRKEWYDFFLVSQHVRQGTVSPTHYVVVHDTTHWNEDYVQRLTYKLTHLYYNWPGTVSVPAPCLYAHRLAYLVGQNIRRDPAPVLADRLFYL